MSGTSRPVVERLLAQASMRWRRLHFIRRTAHLAALATGLVLLFGIMMVLGWWTDATWVAVGFALAFVGALLAWTVMTLVTFCAPDSDRESSLAAAVERCHRPLMDRLNTLVFLQSNRDAQLEAFAARIEQQTQAVLRRQPPTLPFPPQRAVIPITLFAVLFLLTVGFYGHFRPWQQLEVATQASESPPTNVALFEIPWVPESTQEALQESSQESPWGDVRISEPGMDLRVTSLDIVPLRIEAASNRPLERVEWFTAVNGLEPVLHDLPPPGDPWYAVYGPELSVPDLVAEPWDVVRYYARATTEDGTTYESERYFIELVPFRDELDPLTGGGETRESRQIQQLTSMIRRQNEVMRQTDHQRRSPNSSAETQKTRVEKLAGEEAALRKEASHLAAEIAAGDDTSETAEPDRRLRGAASTLEHAEDALLDDDLDQAMRSQRLALDQLIAARKELLQLWQENRDASQPLAGEEPEREPAKGESDIDRLDERIQEMVADRQQLQGAREFVQGVLLKERNIERQADPRQQKRFPELTQQQQDLNESLDEFVRENGATFSQAKAECSRAQGHMRRAHGSLAGEDKNARQDAGRAADALQELDARLEEQQQLWDRLADAYRIREMFEQQMSQLGECQQSGVKPGQGEQLAAQAESATRQLKQIAEGEATREFFDDALRESLDDENMERVAGQCQRLGKSENPGGQKTAAGELERTLRQIAQAFDASCPGGSGQGGQGDPLIPSGQTAIARGMRSLESAAGSGRGDRALSKQDRERLVQESRRNLMTGFSSLYGADAKSQPLIQQLDEQLEEPPHLIDMQTVQELMRDIQRQSREQLPDDRMRPADAERTRHVDLSRLPPDYRQSIETYFEKLSEQ